MNVAVIGASNKEHRYSYQACCLLKEKGHQVYAVHQRIKEINSEPVYASITHIKDDINTVAMYVGAHVSDHIGEDILSVKPRRIIFNPGAENADLEMKAKNKGIDVVRACTLVMLRTGQF